MKSSKGWAGMTALAFAGLIAVSVGGRVDAQVAGSTTVGVTVEELKVVALGWRPAGGQGRIRRR